MKPLHGTSLSKGTRDPDCVFILTTQYSRWLLLALRWVSVLALEEIVFGLSCFQIKKAARICILIPPLRKSYHKLNVSVLVLFEVSGSLGNITAEWIMDFIKVQGSFTGLIAPLQSCLSTTRASVIAVRMFFMASLSEFTRTWRRSFSLLSFL